MNEVINRFWSKVSFGQGAVGCWHWEGGRNKDGYGVFWYDGRQWIASRFSFNFLVKGIPAGLVVCHKCDNPQCIRPDHLFIGTHKDNELDKLSKGRHYQSNKTHCPKGHEYSEENTCVRSGSGYRLCRTCARDKQRLRKQNASNQSV